MTPAEFTELAEGREEFFADLYREPTAYARHEFIDREWNAALTAAAEKLAQAGYGVPS